MEVFKILGQSSPGAAANTTLYTVPATTRTIVHNLTICNTNGTNQTVRVYIVPSGGSAAIANAIYYGNTIYANGTVTIGPFTMGPGDFIVVYASATNLSFNVFGSEIS